MLLTREPPRAGHPTTSRRFGLRQPITLSDLTTIFTPVVLILGIPSLLVLSTPSPGFTTYNLGFWIIVVWSGCRLTICSLRGIRTLPTMVFYLFVYVWLGLAPLLQLAVGKRPLPMPVESADYAFASVVVLVGLFAYEIGRHGPQRPLSRARSFRSGLPIRGLAICSLVICVLVTVKLGGLSFLLSSRQEVSSILYNVPGSADKSTGAITSVLLTIPIFVVCIVYLTGHQRQRNWLDRTLMTALILANVVVNNPISQSRFWFTTVWGTILLVLFARSAKITGRTLPLVLVAATLFIFPAADVFRYANSSLQQVEWRSPVIQLSEKGDFDSVEQIAWGSRLAREEGFTNGRQTIGALLFWLPRTVWPEKPYDTGIELAEKANFGNTSLSAPLWIETFRDGGWGLLVAVFAGLGYLHRLLERRVKQQTISASFFLLSLYQLVILRGSLIASMAGTAALIGCYWVSTRRPS
jgi:hypothetical protein